VDETADVVTMLILFQQCSFFMSGSLGTFLTVIFSLFPWSLLVKGFDDLGAATQWGRPGRYEFYMFVNSN